MFNLMRILNRADKYNFKIEKQMIIKANTNCLKIDFFQFV